MFVKLMEDRFLNSNENYESNDDYFDIHKLENDFFYNEKVDNFLSEKVGKYSNGGVIFLEFPSEKYFDMIIATLKYLTNNGYQGIYVSFQRPYNNILMQFEKNNINITKLSIVDCASVLNNEPVSENDRFINISKPFDIDNLVDSISLSLTKADNINRFIIVDSITTLSLFKSEFETKKFSELLIDNIQRDNIGNTIIIFNVAIELSKKQYIRDISIHADEKINLLDYMKKSN